jgi:hypothetical protein
MKDMPDYYIWTNARDRNLEIMISEPMKTELMKQIILEAMRESHGKQVQVERSNGFYVYIQEETYTKKEVAKLCPYIENNDGCEKFILFGEMAIISPIKNILDHTQKQCKEVYVK